MGYRKWRERTIRLFRSLSSILYPLNTLRCVIRVQSDVFAGQVGRPEANAFVSLGKREEETRFPIVADRF